MGNGYLLKSLLIMMNILVPISFLDCHVSSPPLKQREGLQTGVRKKRGPGNEVPQITVFTPYHIFENWFILEC